MGRRGGVVGCGGSILENFDFYSRKLNSQLLYLSKLSSTIIFYKMHMPPYPPTPPPRRRRIMM
jgi:hypothetical protein